MIKSAPASIIFVNSDISDVVLQKLQSQLFITETISGAEFDNRIIVDPNYPTIIHTNDIRLLVVRDLSDHTNRNIADIVLNVKLGLVYIEINKFGPPGHALSIDNIYLSELFYWENAKDVNTHHHHHKHRGKNCI